MPERNHEVIIDSYVYPDVVTVTLSNDDFIGSRDYVSKELYESVIEANAAWQAENARLRELVDCFVLAEAPSRREVLTSNAIGLWAERNGIEVDG